MDQNLESSQIGLPEIVYHYTSMDALVSIATNRNLRATSIAYLNDHQERELFLSAVRERFHDALKLTEELDSDFLRFLRGSPREFSSQDEVSPFVVSFSEEQDSLMHWRSYCPQQNGVAIGFKTACLREARVDQKPEAGMIVEQALFSKVYYIRSSDHEIIDAQIIGIYENALRRHEKYKDLYARAGTGLGHLFREGAETAACFFKHHSFRTENEYRLLLGDLRSREDAVQFRSTRSTLIPFVPLWVPGRVEIEKGAFHKDQSRGPWDAIATLTIGPTVNMDLSVAAARALFRSKGMQVEIQKSRVPYRDW